MYAVQLAGLGDACWTGRPTPPFSTAVAPGRGAGDDRATGDGDDTEDGVGGDGKGEGGTDTGDGGGGEATGEGGGGEAIGEGGGGEAIGEGGGGEATGDGGGGELGGGGDRQSPQVCLQFALTNSLRILYIHCMTTFLERDAKNNSEPTATCKSCTRYHAPVHQYVVSSTYASWIQPVLLHSMRSL